MMKNLDDRLEQSKRFKHQIYTQTIFDTNKTDLKDKSSPNFLKKLKKNKKLDRKNIESDDQNRCNDDKNESLEGIYHSKYVKQKKLQKQKSIKNIRSVSLPKVRDIKTMGSVVRQRSISLANRKMREAINRQRLARLEFKIQ